MTPEADVEVEPQYEDLENQEHTGRFGIWVFIGSEVLFFAALFALYSGYRTHYEAEFAEASHHSKLVLGTINTYVLLTSSLFVALSLWAMKTGRRRLVMALVVLTIVCGFLFMSLKGLEYAEHFSEGIKWGGAFSDPEIANRGAQAYFTLYYVMTGLHAIHVAIGIGLFTWVLVRLFRGHYSPASHLGLEVVGIYWHFVDMVWLFLWPTFYLMH